MLRWDTDWDELKVVLCKEIYLTGEHEVSLMESQNKLEDLQEYWKYHRARLSKKDDIHFVDAQFSRRCISALEFYKK